MQILLIEDDEGVIAMTRNAFGVLFSKSNHSLLIAETLSFGWEVLRINTVDLILLDLNLPDSPVENTLKEIPALAECAPVVVVTGYGDVASQCLSNGAAGFIYKTPELYVQRLEIIRRLIREVRQWGKDHRFNENLELLEDLANAVANA